MFGQSWAQERAQRPRLEKRYINQRKLTREIDSKAPMLKVRLVGPEIVGSGPLSARGGLGKAPAGASLDLHRFSAREANSKAIPKLFELTCDCIGASNFAAVVAGVLGFATCWAPTLLPRHAARRVVKTHPCDGYLIVSLTCNHSVIFHLRLLA